MQAEVWVSLASSMAFSIYEVIPIAQTNYVQTTGDWQWRKQLHRCL